MVDQCTVESTSQVAFSVCNFSCVFAAQASVVVLTYLNAGQLTSLHTLEESVTHSSKMEQELIGYKEKVENMKLLLKHYQAQLESQKVRRDGVETVSRLLAESRQENARLKKNQATMETLIKNLQNRLELNGLSGKTDEDDEVIMPAMSKQTLNNLALENKRLRSMLQKEGTNSLPIESVDSEHKSKEETETEQTLRQTVDKLEAENKSMKMKLFDLEALFKSSNNEKDRQLISYQEEVRALRQGSSSTPVSGKALSGLPTLREQLRSLVAQCQTLEGQLEKAEESQPRHVELTRITPSSQKDAVDGVEVKQLMEEKQKLQEKLNEVTLMNQRWQAFFQEREKYTADLEMQVRDLDERLKDALHGGANDEVKRQLEEYMARSQEKIAAVEESRSKAEDEAEHLKRIVQAKEDEITQLRSEVSILSHRSSGVDTSIIEHLKAQIQVCTEDFEKERQDRQAALQKVNSLQEQVTRLQKLNSHLQTMLSNQAGPARPSPQEHAHAQYGHLDHGGNLQPRGGRYGALEYDCPISPQGGKDLRDPMRDFPDFDYEQPRDHMGPMSMPGTATELIARNPGPRPKHSVSATELTPCLAEEVKHDNFLTCPKCNKEFSEERQGELLAHMDACWE
ncbi:hypothetical protein BaRGS_00023861 [Batillaria attramentaria]|uniref:Uncharacterized protein n=1 Tax=Batillaria attramentaria TaxID=370345 RepID=A0ABD0KD73_9CAEN